MHSEPRRDRLGRLSPGGEVALVMALTYAVIFGTAAAGVFTWFAYAIFLYLPVGVAWLRNEDFARYGLLVADRRRTVREAIGNALVIFPLFTLGYAIALRWVPQLPPLRFGFDADVGQVLLFALLQVVVVGLAEEYFYRGYLQERLDRIWPPRWRLLGAVVGPGWIVQSVLFAVGHLGQGLNPGRLATFFPGLWFGWVKARTGNVYAGIALHALANLLIAWLQGQAVGG